MAKKVSTVFVRDDAINLLVMRGERVEKWASLPLEAGLVNHGLITDPARVAERLKELFKLKKVPMGRVIAGISGHNSVFRIITLPELPDDVLPEAVKREAKRAIPVPLEEVYLSYQTIPTIRGETLVFLAAFPRNIVDTLRQTLQRAGLNPYVMDLAPLALCRTANLPRSIIVNDRADNLDIIVMADRIPQLIRRLSLPSEEESPAERLATITEEVDRTIAFYNTGHQAEPLDAKVPMLVGGDLARTPEKWQALANRTSHPVSILPAPVEAPEGFDASDYMVNIGLALKELLTEKGESNHSLININTLPEVYKPKPVRARNVAAPLFITIGLAIIIGIAFLVFNKMSYIDTLNEELAPLQDLVAERTGEIAELQASIDEITPQLTELGNAATALNGTFVDLSNARLKMNSDVSQIVNLLPGTMTLTTVNHVGDAINVIGLSPTEAGVFSYARALRNGDRFPTVVISSIEAIVENEQVVRYKFEFLLR
jgi:type IV pilus assembly protein PilM